MMYNQILQAQQSGQSPEKILKTLKANSSPEQIQNVQQQARQMGVPDNIISQINKL